MDDQSIETREQVDDDPRDPHGLVGKDLDGRVLIEGVIGEGGMGVVYLGHQTTVDRKVAVKVLLPERCDEETVRRFQNEARAASRLSHPNTITVHDFGNFGDLLYIVMEFLEGQALQDVFDKEKPLSAARMFKIVSQVLASLAEAHQVGIIHRDIKPDNVFLKRVGAEMDFVKVLDFGVAKLGEQLRGDATLTKAGMIFGTPKYMSPEQATAKQLDARSDLYSVGIMMYEALTGRAPFTASDPVSILIQHVHEDPPPIHEVAPQLQIPHEIQQVIYTAMAKDPNHRYPSAVAMKAVVDEILLGLQSGVVTVQAHGIPSATGSVPGQPPATPSQPSPTGPAVPADSGTWADELGISGAPHHPGPTAASGVGAPVADPSLVITHGGPGRGILISIIIVGVLLVGAVGWLIYQQMGAGDGHEADAAVEVDAGESLVDGGIAIIDAAAPVEDSGPVETPDAAATEDAVVVEEPSLTQDAVAALDEPDSATPDAAAPDAAAPDAAAPEEDGAEEDTVAVLQPDVLESPEQDPVRVRFRLDPSDIDLSFRGRDYRRDGRYYVFDRADGDEFRVGASADHHLDSRVRVDLDDADDDGVVTVRIRLELDPCDPANGPVDPYVCD